MSDPRMDEMHQWLAAVCKELNIRPDVLDGSSDALLDLVRDIAHGPSRPAAPLTMLLIGLTVGATTDHSAEADPSDIDGAILDRAAAIEGLISTYQDS